MADDSNRWDAIASAIYYNARASSDDLDMVAQLQEELRDGQFSTLLAYIWARAVSTDVMSVPTYKRVAAATLSTIHKLITLYAAFEPYLRDECAANLPVDRKVDEKVSRETFGKRGV